MSLCRRGQTCLDFREVRVVCVARCCVPLIAHHQLLTAIMYSYLRELQSCQALNTPLSRGTDGTISVQYTGRRHSDPASDIVVSLPSPQPVPHPRIELPEAPAEPLPATIQPGFRQNPLADNDYTFATAAGRYCQ